MDKPLLILDIDETLLHASKVILDYPEVCKVFDYYIYLRPQLDYFLSKVQKSYLLALWSSAGDDYVNKVVANTLLKNYKFEFIWGNSRATYRRNFEREEMRYFGNHLDHYHYVKPLKKVKKMGYSLNRILIVDDSPHKSQLNYGNAIYPKPYTGEKDDEELNYLSLYLEKIKDYPNYRKLEKRNWRYQVKSTK